MLEWLLYNTLFPLLPVPLVYVGSWMVANRRKWLSIIRDGQLCFYCTTLSAIAIRDFVKMAGQSQSIAIPLAGILFCMVFSIFAYGIAITHADPANDWKLGLTSLGIAVATTVVVAITRQAMGILK
jgi:hypothetical protein